MVISSRRSLLPRPEEKTISPAVFLIICFFILATWMLPIILGHPITLDACLFLLFSTLVGVAYIISYIFNRVSLRRLVEQRKDDSICTFARSFNYRHVDTRIIRALYEEAQHWLNFPVRASDNFKKDLDFDSEDLEDMAQIIAYRTKRTLDHFEQNPYYGQINTVAEMVLFFSHQPLRTDSKAHA